MIERIKNEVERRKAFFSDAREDNAKSNLFSLLVSSFAAIFLLIIFFIIAPFIIKGWKPSLQHILFLPALILFHIIHTFFLYNFSSWFPV